MLSANRQIAAVTVLAFLGVAILCVETNRAALQRNASINSRGPGNRHAPAGQLKALKRATYIENDSAPSDDSRRAPWRYLSSKERRAENPVGGLDLAFSLGVVPAHKVSTNVFLSVLNL